MKVYVLDTFRSYLCWQVLYHLLAIADEPGQVETSISAQRPAYRYQVQGIFRGKFVIYVEVLLDELSCPPIWFLSVSNILQRIVGTTRR